MPVEVSVRPRFAIAPTDISVTVRIEPHKANRRLWIAIDGENFYRTRLIQLEGEDSPRIFQDFYSIRYPGTYTITAQVERAGESDPSHSITFCAIGPEHPCEPDQQSPN